jgi:hypothetical protein
MATSIQIARDRYTAINDLDLLALISMLNFYHSTRPSCRTCLNEWIYKWNTSCTCYAPGTLDLDLEVLVEDESTRIDFLTVLSYVEGKLHDLGGHVPARLLQQHSTARGVVFNDFPVACIVHAISQVRTLIE